MRRTNSKKLIILIDHPYKLASLKMQNQPQPQYVVRGSGQAQIGQVVVTPLSRSARPVYVAVQESFSQCSTHKAATFFSKVYLRAISKNAKKEEKTFVLRDIDTSKVLSCSDLKEIIRAQLYEDIICDDFDVGVISNTSVVRVRTKKDLSELWSDVKNAKTKAVLWCDGLIDKSNQKRKSGETVDSEDDKPSKKKARKSQPDTDKKVQDVVNDLKAKHTSGYTPMQLRIWAEMIVTGLYENTDSPPTTSMFVRAGGATSAKKRNELPAPSGSAIASPTKVIDGRSKLYKQLTELQSLKASGVLSEDEYVKDKGSIMSLLKELSSVK